MLADGPGMRHARFAARRRPAFASMFPLRSRAARNLPPAAPFFWRRLLGAALLGVPERRAWRSVRTSNHELETRLSRGRIHRTAMPRDIRHFIASPVVIDLSHRLAPAGTARSRNVDRHARRSNRVLTGYPTFLDYREAHRGSARAGRQARSDRYRCVRPDEDIGIRCFHQPPRYRGRTRTLVRRWSRRRCFAPRCSFCANMVGSEETPRTLRRR